THEQRCLPAFLERTSRAASGPAGRCQGVLLTPLVMDEPRAVQGPTRIGSRIEAPKSAFIRSNQLRPGRTAREFEVLLPRPGERELTVVVGVSVVARFLERSGRPLHAPKGSLPSSKPVRPHDESVCSM